MSHFCGLVILTPEYQKTHNFEDSLEKYSEHNDVPEYSRGKVSDYDKATFMCCYDEEYKKNVLNVREVFAKAMEGRNAGKTFKDYQEQFKDNSLPDYYNWLSYNMQDEYGAFWFGMNPEAREKFAALYDEKGESWNGNSWRVNPLTGDYEEYSTYNPDSKWDWYDKGGRWNCCIKTKSGEFVNKCLLGEIDWTDFKPEDYKEKPEKDIWGREYKALKEDVRYHYTKSNVPFCLVVDGNWIEKGKMLYWGLTSNEKKDKPWSEEFLAILDRLPENSEVYNVDFHI